MANGQEIFLENQSAKIYNQSAVIPFEEINDKLKVLVITSRKKKHWIIPKGFIEDDLTAIASARQEAFEEAGITGKIFPDPVGDYSYEKWGIVCNVLVFPMRVSQVLNDWPEAYLRDRQWLDLNDAVKIVSNADLKNIIAKLPKYLSENNYAGSDKLKTES